MSKMTMKFEKDDIIAGDNNKDYAVTDEENKQEEHDAVHDGDDIIMCSYVLVKQTL